MKNSIEEVQHYFNTKIINAKYEVLEIDEHTITVIIDNEYRFCLWIANDGYSFGLYDGSYNFMQIKLSEVDKKKAFNNVKLIIKKNYNEKIKPKKLEQYNKLKKELGIK